MFFTKQDRKDLQFVKRILQDLQEKVVEETSILPEQLGVPTDKPLLSYLQRKLKEKEEEVKVSGSMDLSSAAEEELEERRNNIEAKLSREDLVNKPYYKEDLLTDEELEDID